MGIPFKIAVESVENRGGDDAKYGYVYFNDETRVGFAIGLDDTRGSHGLFSGNWGGNTNEHFKAAIAALYQYDWYTAVYGTAESDSRAVDPEMKRTLAGR